MHRYPHSSFCSFAFRAFLSVLVLAMPTCPVWAGTTLRRSNSSSTASTSGNNGTGGTAVTTGTPVAKASLRRAIDVTSAVTAMQKAATDAAKVNTVKTQLKVAGGTTPLLWVGANKVADSTGSLTVTQTNQNAYLEWSKFDLGSGDTLTFDQSAGGADVNNWIAFNYVRDPYAKASQIFGTINTLGANNTVGGQVYILNANGILFGGTAKVNTHALVASSLPINPVLLQRGLLVQNVKDVQFLFDSIKTSSYDPGLVTDYSPAQTPGVDGKGTTYGEINVQPGAVLTAYDDEANHIGGRVALIGRNVINAGKIETNDGQTILAAGLQVGLVAHNSADPTLRGLDAYVGQVGTDSDTGRAENWGVPDSRGKLIDGGLIEAHRGSVYITGKTVSQNGVIDSSTSVSYNGRIDLVAGYGAIANALYDPSINGLSLLPFYFRSNVGDALEGLPVANSGQVNLGAGSVTSILPDYTSTERVVGDLALPSQINIEGSAVHFAEQSTLVAPGAVVPPTKDDGQGNSVVSRAYGADGIALDAGVTVQAGGWSAGTAQDFVHTDDSQAISLESGATIDVAGLSGVSASVTENIISVELRGSELAGSPLQRDGALRGQTIKVDLRQHGAWDKTLNGGLGGYTWVGTPLADTSGWVGLTSHTVAELSTNGGSVSLKAGGAVALQAGATIDVSGGSIEYQGGYVETTKVVSAGHIYDIAQATADRVYDGIYKSTTTTVDAKWGLATTTVNSLRTGSYEADYTQGGNGGSLSITAPVFALPDGTLSGTTTTGIRQRTLSPIYDSTDPTTYNPKTPKALSGLGWLLNAYNLPVPSQLAITVGQQYFSKIDNGFYYFSPTPANILIADSASHAALSDLYSQSYELDLNPNLFKVSAGGFGILTINNADDNVGAISYGKDNKPLVGNITLGSNTMLEMSVGGVLNLSAANIYLESGSQINLPGGSVSLAAYDVSPSVATVYPKYGLAGKTPPSTAVPIYDSERGTISIDKAAISTAGDVADDRQNQTPGTKVNSGGKISLVASSIDLTSGAVLDVSSGAAIAANGSITYGDAGKITLKSSRSISSSSSDPVVFGGSLQIESGVYFKGYAGVGKKGGTLDITAPAIRILAETLADGQTLETDPNSGMMSIAPDFFNQGGFTTFSLTGLGIAVDGKGRLDLDKKSIPQYAFEVAEGATIAPQVLNWASDPRDGGLFSYSPYLRKSVTLSFSSQGKLSGFNSQNLQNDDLGNATGLLLGEKSSLVVDYGAGGAGEIDLIALSGGTIDVRGHMTAKGGKIVLNQTNGSDGGSFTPTIYLASTSSLDASGVALWAFNGSHHRLSVEDESADNFIKVGVADGGSISVSGNIVAEAGSDLNVSGTSSKIWQMPGILAGGIRQVSSPALVSLVKDSNGGAITLTADQVLLTQATLEGKAGGTTARGGDFTIVSNRNSKFGGTDAYKATAVDPVLILKALNPDFEYHGFGQLVTVEDSVTQKDTGVKFADSRRFGQIIFGAESAGLRAGFDSLTLSVGDDAIQVQGDVKLSATRQIAIANSGVLSFAPDPLSQVTPSAQVLGLSLSASYVKLGQDFLEPAVTPKPLPAPVTGSGTLSVAASSLIDVGNIVFLGANAVTLDATYDTTFKRSRSTNGSIRGDGTFDLAGNVTLAAGQIYAPSAVAFNVVARDFQTADGKKQLGTVTILPGNGQLPEVPLSAGGKLGVYASVIDQGGVLRAPLGQIFLGSGSGADPLLGHDPLSGSALPVTSKLTLQSGSITSVSAVDPTTDKALTIPYGVDVNGETWIAPSGVDITNLGPTAKAITLTASSIDFKAADQSLKLDPATVDLSGGGDLLAYRFVPGAGGKKDVLGDLSKGAFAVVPSYGDSYAPYALNNNKSAEAIAALGSDAGFVLNADPTKGPTYSIGDRIYLKGGGGLAEGFYTILPARYALLAGAFLVTPKSTAVTAGAAVTTLLPEGAALVSGFRFNGFDPVNSQLVNNGSQQVYSTFEVASQAVVTKRAQYDTFYGDKFFADAAAKLGSVTPRTAVDAGQLVFAAGALLNLQGKVSASLPSSGRGAMIDISSLADIQIGGPLVSAKVLWLDPTELSDFGAESLLIGGTRSTGGTLTTITATTQNLTVGNIGNPLVGSDIILASTKTLTVDDGAEIHGSSTSANFTAESLRVVGDGALVRVSSDADTSFARAHLIDENGGSVAFNTGKLGSQLTVGTTVDGVPSITGTSVILDSSANATIAANASIGGSSSHIALSGGLISIQLPGDKSEISTGLVLKGGTLGVFNAAALSLLSYSSIDFYGTGQLGSNALDPLSFHAAALRNGEAGSNVKITAKNIRLDNIGGATLATAPALPATSRGQLELDAKDVLRLGSNSLETLNFDSVTFSANGAVAAEDTGGFSVIGGSFTVQTPLLVTTAKANQSLAADGYLKIQSVAQNTTEAQNASVLPGLAGKLSLTGASVSIDGTAIELPSGTLTMESTGTKATDNINIEVGDNSRVDVGGITQTFFDVSKSTNGGTINLISNHGNVLLSTGAVLSVGYFGDTASSWDDVTRLWTGDAGTLKISAPTGVFDPTGAQLLGHSGVGQNLGGSFSLDVSSIPGDTLGTSKLGALHYLLNNGGFSQSVALRVRTGDVEVDTVKVQGTDYGTLRTHNYALSADHGNIAVNAGAVIDASGFGSIDSTAAGIDPTGGSISLAATGSVVLDAGSRLSAAGYCYDNSGKGGTISLSAGGYVFDEKQQAVDPSYIGSVDKDAVVSIDKDARIDLNVAHAFTTEDIVLTGSYTPASSTLSGLPTDGSGGTLHLRESQAALLKNTKQFDDYDDGHRIRGASSVVLEGFMVYDLTGQDPTPTPNVDQTITSIGTNGLIDLSVQNTVKSNGVAFAKKINSSLDHTLFHFEVGAEIVNNSPDALDPLTVKVGRSTSEIDTAGGDLVLANNWDLSQFRFGNEPGILTLRAKNNLVFVVGASLSDGFDPSKPGYDTKSNSAVNAPLWMATLMADRSWSYNLVAGADYTAAGAQQVRSSSEFKDDASAGSVLVGFGSPSLPVAQDTSSRTLNNYTRAFLVPQYYQTIRTGTGDINIAAGRDVKLLNPLATIYTSGRAAVDPVPNFDLPLPNAGNELDIRPKPYYIAQYGQAGGNVTVSAQYDIVRQVLNDNGELVDDSSKEMPTNWLYRRDSVGADGRFAALRSQSSDFSSYDEIQSTTWWVDYSNFFDDVGALGGGNVALTAGHDVKNVNASVATNARMPGYYKDKSGNKVTIAPDAAKLVELGGGNLSVQAGNDINGGVYYTERGDTTLYAGAQVTTNATRDVTVADLSDSVATNWLPTTFFLGKGRVNVVSGGDLLLGTVANPFLCYPGTGNRSFETSYFSTFDPTDAVTASSLGGKVTLESQPNNDSSASIFTWYANVLNSKADVLDWGASQPWLNLSGIWVSGNPTTLDESSARKTMSILPGSLYITAFAGDITVVGSLTLNPAKQGSVDLLAAGNINGWSENGDDSWASAVINLSDAAALPSFISPLSFSSYVLGNANKATNDLLKDLADSMAESGSTQLTLAQKLKLHGEVNAEPLHAGDDTGPLHLYATGGDLSGLTLFSAKSARVAASNDLTDIALYIQNVHSGDVSLVTAGRDIIAYDPISALRLKAGLTNLDGIVGPASDAPAAGDIQVSGPGTLEVLAGRDLTLGSGALAQKDGTAAGITSVGTTRNPYLSLTVSQSGGADIIAAAGIRQSTISSTGTGPAFVPGLASTGFNYDAFISAFLEPHTENGDLYLPVLGALMGGADAGADTETIANDFKKYYVVSTSLSEKQASWVMQVFSRVLRDAGRDHNDPDSPHVHTYDMGFEAIRTFMPGSLLPDSASGLVSGWQGNISMPTKLIKTFEGGDVSLVVPGGQLMVGRSTDKQTPDQGILTQSGGNISIFASGNVDVGTSRIFTLRGGDEVIWSSQGNIAAGSGSKTVHSAPPTRVLVDPQSADVQNDLAGLATGSGIGVLATLATVAPGNVDLIAPAGTIDAGDAGIRSSGKINVSAVTVVNAANIQSSAGTTGTPVVVAPNVSGLTTAANTNAGASSTATEAARQQQRAATQQQEEALPSIIQVEVIGYGGGDGDEQLSATKKPADQG